MTFELPLTETRVKPHQVTALHLLAALTMAGVGAILSSFYPPAKNWAPALLVAGILLLLVTLFRNRWIQKPKNNRIFRILELMILLCLACYFVMIPMKVPAAMCSLMAATLLFALYWEQQDGAALSVRIDETGVKLPVASRRRQLSWTEVEQVLFRFGTLTVNCYNNSMYQWTIGKTDFDKEAFAAFCEKQVAAGNEKRDKNDW
jgi:hypothetical protein